MLVHNPLSSLVHTRVTALVRRDLDTLGPMTPQEERAIALFTKRIFDLKIPFVDSPILKRTNQEIEKLPKVGGAQLNARYDAFKESTLAAKRDPSPQNIVAREEATTALCKDIENMAFYSTFDVAGKQAWSFASQLNQRVKDEGSTDIVQNVLLKVWMNLDSFRGQCKFSTWLYEIIKNETISTVRTEARRKEGQLFDWKAYGDEYAGKKNGGNKGASPSTRESNKVTSVGRSLGFKDAPPQTNSDDFGADSFGNGEQDIHTKEFFEESETAYITSDELNYYLNLLSIEDRVLFMFKFDQGHTIAAIAQFFGRNRRWVHNHIFAIRRQLRAARDERERGAKR
jgi:RNA polymerase sigma factor (sigma-70 family)